MQNDRTLPQHLALLKTHVPLLADVNQRIAVLKRLQQMIVENTTQICDAISVDFRYRSCNETLLGEIYPLLAEIKHTLRSIKSWLKPKRVSIETVFLPARAKVVFQPLGVVGIMVPWNYPLFLALSPLVGAIAAGNCCMIKMSELSPALGMLLSKLFAEHFPEQIVSIINGDIIVSSQFTQLPFNYLLFTGSTPVGKKVMAAASENLTPVTLELGGKSPVIIDDQFSMNEAVTCIMRGKLLNAGQTCVAPDYVFVPKQREQEFIEAVQKITKKLYPTLADNPDYSAIINDAHWQRLKNLEQDAQQKGARWLPLSEDIANKSSVKFQPALMLDVTDTMQISQQEIFGPILIVKTYHSLNEALDYINARSNPLALYCFTRDKHIEQQIAEKTLSGTLSFNETIIQIVQNNLPFGGVGESGMGHYHGRYSMETFSKLKPIYQQGRFHPANMLKPPYNAIFKRILKLLMR